MITALFGLPIGDSRCRDYLCYWYVGVEENYFRKILSAAVITAESHHPPRLVQREQWVVNILAAAMWEADKCREGGRARPARTSCRPSRTHSRPTKTPRHSFRIVSSTTAPIKIIQSIIFALPCFRFCPDAGHGKIVCDGIGCFRVELVTAVWRVLESSWRWQQLWGLSSSLWSQRAVSRTPANQVTTTQQQRPHVTLTLGTHQLRPHQPSQTPGLVQPQGGDQDQQWPLCGGRGGAAEPVKTNVVTEWWPAGHRPQTPRSIHIHQESEEWYTGLWTWTSCLLLFCPMSCLWSSHCPAAALTA